MPIQIDSITNKNALERQARHKLFGVYIAIVDNNKSPDGTYSVKVRLPWLSNGADESTFWARVCAPGAGKDRGVFWLPEVNDEVCVAFENGEISHPIVLSSLYSKANPVYEKNSDQGGKNDKRVLQARSGHRVEMDDGSATKFTITSTSGHTMCMDDAGTILLKTSDGAHSVLLDQGGKIECKTSGDFIVKADGNIKMTAGAKIETKSSADTEMKAPNVKIQADATFLLKAGGSGEVNGGGQLVVKAGVVNIN